MKNEEGNVIKWKEEYSVGIRQVDEQHKRLFDLTNRLIKARKDPAGRESLRVFLSELMDYTHYHFQAEEVLFGHLPTARYHKAEHAQFIESLKGLTAGFLREERNLDSRLLSFLVTWLRDHILKTDKRTFKHGPVVREAGKGASPESSDSCPWAVPAACFILNTQKKRKGI